LPVADIVKAQGDDGESPSADVLTDQARPRLMALCAQYLLHEKRGQQPLDPVARFHLANGARLERLNWKGNLSASGLRQSLGITANYLYRVADVESNHEAYATQGRVIASASVTRLARAAVRRDRTR
jgi:malonyl-CoA decarboxylase